MLRIAIPYFIVVLLDGAARAVGAGPAIAQLQALANCGAIEKRSGRSANIAGTTQAAATGWESNGGAMDFSYTPEQEAFRMEVRQWLAADLAPELCIDDPAAGGVAPTRERVEQRPATHAQT